MSWIDYAFLFTLLITFFSYAILQFGDNRYNRIDYQSFIISRNIIVVCTIDIFLIYSFTKIYKHTVLFVLKFKKISTNPEGLQMAQGLYQLAAFFLHLWSDRAQVTVYMMKDVST